MKIASLYYFNYQGDVGYYDSYRNFCLKNMIYLGMAISTPRVHVHASPTEYLISNERSEQIREYVEQHLLELKLLSKGDLKESVEYIKVIYVDGSECCYECTEDFVKIFKNTETYRVSGECDVIMAPFLVFEDKSYGRCVAKIEEFKKLLYEKQLVKIVGLLDEDCILEELYCGQTFESKKAILKELKKRCGFVNMNLSKVSIYGMLEGTLSSDGKSDIVLKVEVYKKGTPKIYYLFQFDFAVSNEIKKITVREYNDLKASKIICGNAIVKIKNGTYNDYENAV